MSIFKACDIRGRIGTELTVDHARQLGRAICRLKGQGKVLVGGDGRLSTPQLKEALIASLLEAGCDVVDVGLVSTPMFYFAREQLGIELGIMVTASHNPAADNGFKITPGPLPITEAEIEAIARWMSSDEPLPRAGSPGRHLAVDLLPAYLAHAEPAIPDLSGLRVVIDCANGMNSLAARPVWEQTGAQLVFLLDEVDGRFPAHAPNPAEKKNLKLLCEQVVLNQANLGVAYDGDGDRVAFVDEGGQEITGDQVIVLFSQLVLANGPQRIVFDQKCSRVVPEFIQARGGTAILERSGHTYMKRAFLSSGAAYAGELSGHHFLQPFGDDALLASLLFARLVKEEGRPISQRIAEITAYATTPDLRIPMPEARVQQVLAELETRFANQAILSHLDGLRIELPDGWGLVRPSVTEPVITLRFEGADQDALTRILRQVEDIVPEITGALNVVR